MLYGSVAAGAAVLALILGGAAYFLVRKPSGRLKGYDFESESGIGGAADSCYSEATPNMALLTR